LTDDSAEGSYEEYKQKQAKSGPSTIGDLLKEEMDNKAQE
jgi:hypothetical protein